MTEPLTHIRRALADLRHARDLLRLAGADKAAEAVNRAIKSAEGAERHARGKSDRAPYARAPAPRPIPELAEPRGCKWCDENPEGDYTGTDATRWRCRACDNWNAKDSRWLHAADRY